MRPKSKTPSIIEVILEGSFKLDHAENAEKIGGMDKKLGLSNPS